LTYFAVLLIRVKVVEIPASDLRNTAPCRDVSFHPLHHSLASICYQTKKVNRLNNLIQIFEHFFLKII